MIFTAIPPYLTQENKKKVDTGNNKVGARNSDVHLRFVDKEWNK